MNWERFWWNNVPGPRSVISAVADYVISGKCAHIVRGETLSWRAHMRELAKEEIEQSGALTVKYIRASEELQDGEVVGDYLLRRYTNREGYRPHLEKWWEYIKRMGALNATLLWVYDIESDRIPKWRDACRQMKGACLFVMESERDSAAVSGFETVDAESHVLEYDYLLLASQVVAERADIPDVWRCYISDLAAERYAGDAERIVDFIGRYDISRPPAESGDVAAHKAVWKAQLRNAYHRIEEGRTSLIRHHAELIGACLPEVQFKEEVCDPYDAELGLLCYLTTQKREAEGKRRLVLPHDDYVWLHFLHDMRNKLAHNDTLTPQEMERLLTGSCDA